jgi:AcrR family transcriptional regulator
MAAAWKRISAKDRRQQILSVAMNLFARQGFRGTTTQQISRNAGINEAILFRHFPHKEDLYWAVIEGNCRSSRTRGKHDLAQRLLNTQDDRELFATIAQDWLERDRKDVAMSRLLLFTALENHRLSHRFFRTRMARYYETLARHIRKRIQERGFRPVDPVLAARGFLGMVIYHIWVQELFGGGRYQKFDAKSVSRKLADIWLQGVRISGENGRRRTRPHRGVRAARLSGSRAK